MTERRPSRPLLSAALALLAIPAGLALWAQTPPPVDVDPPQIQVRESGVDLVDGRRFNRAVTPVVEVTDASAIDVLDVEVDGDDLPANTQVTGDGTHTLTVTATDAAGNTATVSLGFEIDTVPPGFVSVTPVNDTVTRDAQVTLRGRLSGAASLTVDGQAVALTGQDFVAGPFSLAEGTRTWDLVATDAAGNTATAAHRVTRDTNAPTVKISQPAAGALTAESSIDAAGTAQDPRLTKVTVNGVTATVSGTAWTAPRVPLAEGSNRIVARAEDRAGNAAEAAATVVRDSQPPGLAITDPAPGTVVPETAITLRGRASDARLDRVTVNGTRAQLNGEVWSLTVNLAEGINGFAVRAFDAAGNSSDASVSVTRDAAAPAVRIEQPADGARLNAATVAVSGTAAEGAVSLTVNGIAAELSAGAFTAPGIALVEGENTLIARAKDGAGKEGTHTRTVTRDTAAPRLLGADPASGALAVPSDAAFRLTFSERMAQPAAGSWSLETGASQALPAIAAIAATATLDGDVLTVRPTAALPSAAQIRLVLTGGLTDLAGNALASPPTLTWLTADSAAPAAPVLTPAPAARLCASTLTLTGTAEAGAVVRAEGGAAAAEVRAGEAGQFSLTVQLAPGGLNRLQVTAADSGGNRSAATIAEVVHDCEAPRVLTAERQGDLFRIAFSEPVTAASVSGAVTLSSPSGPIAGDVLLAANGLTATFDPGATLPTGSLRLDVGTAVLDLAGNALAYPFSQVFGAQAGSGFLSGTVIDNATGRPLAGARVLVFATNGSTLAEPRPEQITGEDGRFRLPVPVGTHELTIARPGYTPSFRIATTAAGQGTDVFDPRLTPVEDEVTRLDEQGLPALLPYGWSPRGAAWVAMDGGTLSSLDLTVDSPSGTTLVLVHLETGTLQWRVLGTAQVSGGVVTIEPASGTTLADGGYAAVEADDGALAPPAPVTGAVLAGSARPMGNEPTAATLTFNPEVVLPSQSSLATAVYTLSQNAASGLPLTLVIEEELTLLDGSVRRQAPYQADLILYHAPDGTPRSRFRLRPSEAAQELPLQLGAEDVKLRTYGGEAVAGNVVGPEGGTVTGADGDRIDLPPGAVTEPTAIALTRRPAADLPLPVPAGTELAGVLDVDLGGRPLLAPAALSLALSPAPAAGSKGLLLQVIDLDGVKAFRAVAALQATATGWTTSPIDAQDLAWPGVREGGLFAFVRFTAGFGYLRGTVFDVSTAALPGAVVRGAGLGWLQIGNADGTYVLPAPVGQASVTAENRATGNQATAAVAMAAADDRVDLDLTLLPVGPRVIQTTPADGAADVTQGIQPTVRFSEPVTAGSLDGAVQLLSEGQPVAVDLEVQGALVRVIPRAALLPGTLHELRVTSGVRDLQNNPLSEPVAVQFTTLRVLLPDEVDLSRIFLIEPDANGDARVLGRPGAVPSNATVFIENRNALIETPTVTAGLDGAFETTVEATLTHTLILHVLIPASNEIVARLTPFRTADLRTAYVGKEAVTFTTGDGVTVQVPAGAFSGPARVRLEPTPVSQTPAPVPAGMAAVYAFNLDFGGAQAAKALQISFPAPAGMPEAVEGVYLLNRMIELLGRRYWMMHDLMRLDPATGRLTTSEAPETTAQVFEPQAVIAALGAPFAYASPQAGGPGGPLPTFKAAPRRYKGYVVGSAFPGQYQVTASEIPLGFTVFPSFSMDAMVGIWNLGMEGMATAINAAIERLLEYDGILMPTRRGQPYTLVVRDLATGFRLFEDAFPAPADGEPVFLPPDVYGDTVPPHPVGGSPLRFLPINLAGGARQEVDLGIYAQLADDTLTIEGDPESTQSKVEIRLIGLDDTAEANATSEESGAFELSVPARKGRRYLLAIGARIGAQTPLDLSFSEALDTDFTGIDVLDAAGNTLDPDKDPIGSHANVRVKLQAGWRAGKSYTLQLGTVLSDAAGNSWDRALSLKFEISGSEDIGTFNLAAVRDVARLGSLLFVAADSDGLVVMDASDPAHVKNLVPNDVKFPFPLADPVRGVAVDPHGRVLVTGGGVSGFGQLKIFDPLALDPAAVAANPNDPAVRFAAFKGSTIISDKLGGPGTQLPSGLPRRVAVLSNDVADEWKIGEVPPAGVTVVPPDVPEDAEGNPVEEFTITVSGTDGRPGLPVTLEDTTLGRWTREDAGTDGHWQLTLEVQPGDRLRVLRNQDSIAYVATTGVGVEVVDVNAFYNEDHNSFIHSDIRGVYSGLDDPKLDLCSRPIGDLGTGLLDLDTLFDADNINPLTVVGLVGRLGFIILRSNPASVGQLSLLNQECVDFEGSTNITGLTVLQHYLFDLDDDGELEDEESRDYVIAAHQKGGVLIYDVTDREDIQLVGRIRMPGTVNQLTVDRQTRRLLAAGSGSGFYIVDLDAAPSFVFLDEDRDGKDDRLLETVALLGNTNSNVRLVPELGLAFAGGLNRGLTTVAVGHPRVEALARGQDGRYRQIDRLAPFGVPTRPETTAPDSPNLAGSFRILAALPGMVANEVRLDVSGVGPAGKPVQELATPAEADQIEGMPRAERTGPQHGVKLRRMAENPWEPGYQLFFSEEVAVLADPRAARKYDRTNDEKEKCTRCEQDDEGVSDDAVEVLSGAFVAVEFPPELRNLLKDVYDKDRLDAAELRLASTPWAPAQPARKSLDEPAGVNTHSGEMMIDATDISVRGRGLDFIFTRSYRSQTIGSGPFGPGWDHGYNLHLRELPNGDVEYSNGRGRRDLYKKQQDGTLKPPTGHFATLEKVASGWVMIDARHNLTRFDAHGRLTSISDAVKDSKDTGNELTFFYGTDNRLVRIHETTDRDVLFEYNDKGLITKITDVADREFLYQYDDKGRLVSVKTPAVETVIAVGEALATQNNPLETQYTYDQGTGSLANTLGGRDNLTSAKDPKGQSWLQVSYNDANGDSRNDEVTSQVWGGGTTSMQYNFGARQATVTDPRGGQTTFTHTEKGEVSSVKDAANATASFTYDAEGLIASRTDALGRVTTYAYDTPCGGGQAIGDRRARGNLTSVTVLPDDRGTNGSAPALVTCTDYEGYSNQPVRVVDARGIVTEIARNAVGLPISVTEAAGTADAAATFTTYNDRGQPTQVINPNGNVTAFSYDANGYPAGYVVDPAGLSLATTYQNDGRGNVVAMTDSRGVRFTRAFNALDWITETRRATTPSTDGAPALNYVTRYFHDANGNVVEERLPFGDDGSAVTRVAHVYDEVDELLQTLEQITPGQPFSEWASTVRFYDLNRNLIKLIEPEGQVTEYGYDLRNLLAGVIRGAGTDDAVTELYGYDLERQRTAVTDGRGHTWTTAYDGYGRVSATVDPLGNRSTVTYDDASNPVAAKAFGAADPGDDPVLLASRVTQYDALDRPKAIFQKLWNPGEDSEDARDITTRFEYDKASNVKKVIDPLGRESTRQYDKAERLLASMDAAGNRVEHDLDKDGNPVATRSIEVQAGGDPVTVTTFAAYDALGRLSSTKDGLNNERKLRYDARDNLRFSVDEENFTTENRYDGLDRLVKTIRPEGITVDLGYDRSSRLLSYKDALSQETNFTYDALNRKTGVLYPGQGANRDKETYLYDASHNVRQITDARGTVITQTFDPATRLTGRTASGGLGLTGPTTESYSYDGLYRTTRAQSGSVVTELTFDSLSRLTREVNAGRAFDFEYDDAGNPTRADYPSDYAVRQTFDVLGRPTSIGPVNGTGAGALYDEAVSYTYRGQGLVTKKTLGNGLVGIRQYDAARRLLDETFRTATGQTVFRESLAWTPRGLKAGQSRGDENGRGLLMAYDGAGRLTHAARSPNPMGAVANNATNSPASLTALPDAFSYAYDAAQNLLAQTQKKGGAAKTVDLPLDGSGRNRPGSVDGVTLEWDKNGNMTRKGDLQLAYDFRNRLTSVSGPGGEVATYQYDAFNRRVGKTVGNETRTTAWRGWQAAEEYIGNDLAQRRTFGLGLDEIVRIETNFDGVGQPQFEYAPLYDETGNLVVMTGPNGKPVERYEYTPYGERRVFVDSTAPAVEQVRVQGGQVWVELSEEVAAAPLAQAVTDGTLKMVRVAEGAEPMSIAIEQPVTTGRQARRRFIVTTTDPPAADTQVRLTIPPGALQDTFLNQPSAAFELTFAWPAADAVVQDETPIKIERVALRAGRLEIELNEEPDLATANAAIQVDGAAAAWTLGDDRYTLKSAAVLPDGSHTVAIATTLTDLSGDALAQAFGTTFTQTGAETRDVFEAPNPRETAISTIGNLFGFQGHPIDPETGLVYIRNRYYDPEMGRFVSTDPMGYVDGPSLYTFASNNPANLGDPSGLCPSCEVMAEHREFEEFVSTLPPEQQAREREMKRKGELQATSVMVGTLPYAGEAHDASQLTMGKDYITGETLTKEDRIAVGVGLALPVVGGQVVRWVAKTPLGKPVVKRLAKWLGVTGDVPPPAPPTRKALPPAPKPSVPAPKPQAPAPTPQPSPPKQEPRFIYDESNGEMVDTHATPRGRYKQPNGDLTDVLQRDDHGAGRSHTHEVDVHRNPKDPTKGTTVKSDRTHQVTYEEAKNIETGKAPPAKKKGRG
jgi:RHS repeat-associated protein